MYQKELASVRRYGLVVPLVVRRLPSRSKSTEGEPTPSPTTNFEIIDGEHRLRVAAELGYTTVPIWDLGDVSEVDAKSLTIILNETHGVADAAALSTLVAQLAESIDLGELSELLPYTDERLAELVSLSDFSWTDPPASAPAAEPAWVERTFRMPPTAAAVLDEAIESVKKAEGEIPDWNALELICADFIGS